MGAYRFGGAADAGKPAELVKCFVDRDESVRTGAAI